MICHYLEMSKDTLGKSKWFPELSDIGARQDGLGCGKYNTYKILNDNTSKKLKEENCAAYRCSKYSTSSTKAGDWWLPSVEELSLIYFNKDKRVIASSTDSWYWSSNEGDIDCAFVLFFDRSSGLGGECCFTDKDKDSSSVLAVRAF